jgi:hypothetical protein
MKTRRSHDQPNIKFDLKACSIRRIQFKAIQSRSFNLKANAIHNLNLTVNLMNLQYEGQLNVSYNVKVKVNPIYNFPYENELNIQESI